MGDLKGKRVMLGRTSDPYTNLRPGALGTVIMEDSLGTVHVDWDDGSSLGLVQGEDSFTVIQDPRKEAD